ncbi:alpha-L-arabinofuranosidase B domain protein [Penicillium sp. IBT 35674x]|nr:alpha-L-arabinofuranosidase B domain protein [Penicillium sp. IBT 35674x]
MMPIMPSFGLSICFGAMGSLVIAGPCDIYGSGNTPCVAGHSTTRALYDSYSGPLYQISRASDSTTADISPVSAGSVADASAHDSFCEGTSCSITIIYDQTGNTNHLTQAPGGGAAPGPDNLASATGAPVMLNGQKAYGVQIQPGMGYRCDTAVGTATGDEPEGMYAVLDGTDYNGACCFDYAMPRQTMTTMVTPIWRRFTLDLLSSKGSQIISIRGGDAASGSLGTYWSGPYPTGYSPMQKEGAIILGIGGDNSNGAQGTFYEGVMTSGYPSDDTENSVQANIVAAKYATSS